LLKDLFVNMSILISFISIGSQVAKKVHFKDKNPLKINISIGLITGILGCILMFFGVQFETHTVLDFRNIPIIISAVWGGILPVIISSSIIALFRVAYFGINLASIYALCVMIVNAVGLMIIIKFKFNRLKKWSYSTLLTLLFSSVAISLMLKTKEDFLSILIIYWLSHIGVATIVYLYVDYSLSLNKLFQRLQKESTKDYLTDLNNVRQFDLVLGSAITNTRAKEENLSLLMIDIDFFKKVNDTYGHHEGDVVLKQLANILVESCRSFDSVSRNGGEEFSAILLDCPNSQALRIAERILLKVNSTPFILSSGIKIPITVSIGVSSYPETTDNLEKIIESADIALYTAKRTGRNKVCSQLPINVTGKPN